jgi:citronellol/citronellal dehydrogenase
MPTLKRRTLFITGASRGIGKAIALRAARDGANIAVVAKTTEPHPRLPGPAAVVDACRLRPRSSEIDVQMRFGSMVTFMVKWAIAAVGTLRRPLSLVWL